MCGQVAMISPTSASDNPCPPFVFGGGSRRRSGANHLEDFFLALSVLWN
jgi:hypothetical protein